MSEDEFRGLEDIGRILIGIRDELARLTDAVKELEQADYTSEIAERLSSIEGLLGERLGED